MKFSGMNAQGEMGMCSLIIAVLLAITLLWSLISELHVKSWLGCTPVLIFTRFRVWTYLTYIIYEPSKLLSICASVFFVTYVRAVEMAMTTQPFVHLLLFTALCTSFTLLIFAVLCYCLAMPARVSTTIAGPWPIIQAALVAHSCVRMTMPIVHLPSSMMRQFKFVRVQYLPFICLVVTLVISSVGILSDAIQYSHPNHIPPHMQPALKKIDHNGVNAQRTATVAVRTTDTLDAAAAADPDRGIHPHKQTNANVQEAGHTPPTDAADAMEGINDVWVPDNIDTMHKADNDSPSRYVTPFPCALLGMWFAWFFLRYIRHDLPPTAALSTFFPEPVRGYVEQLSVIGVGLFASLLPHSSLGGRGDGMRNTNNSGGILPLRAGSTAEREAGGATGERRVSGAGGLFGEGRSASSAHAPMTHAGRPNAHKIHASKVDPMTRGEAAPAALVGEGVGGVTANFPAPPMAMLSAANSNGVGSKNMTTAAAALSSEPTLLPGSTLEDAERRRVLALEALSRRISETALPIQDANGGANNT